MKGEVKKGNIEAPVGKTNGIEGESSSKAPKELFEIVSQVLTFIEIVDGNKKTD